MIDNKHFLDKSGRNNFFFGNFYYFCFCDTLRSCRTTNNFIGVKILNYLIRFYCIILVALVHNYHKMNTVIESVLNML